MESADYVRLNGAADDLKSQMKKLFCVWYVLATLMIAGSIILLCTLGGDVGNSLRPWLISSIVFDLLLIGSTALAWRGVNCQNKRMLIPMLILLFVFIVLDIASIIFALYLASTSGMSTTVSFLPAAIAILTCIFIIRYMKTVNQLENSPPEDE